MCCLFTFRVFLLIRHTVYTTQEYDGNIWQSYDETFPGTWTQMLTSSGCISLVKMFRVIPCVNTNSAHTRTSFQIFKLPEWRISQLPNAFQLYNDNECKNCIHPACKGVDVSCQGRVVRECAKCWYEVERLNKVCGFLLQCFFCLAAFSFFAWLSVWREDLTTPKRCLVLKHWFCARASLALDYTLVWESSCFGFHKIEKLNSWSSLQYENLL